MEFYKSFLTLYDEKGERIARRYCGLKLSETIPENTVNTITWDNLNDYYTKCGAVLPFNIWHRKKGRLISFFIYDMEKSCRDIKEWKTKLNLTIKEEYILEKHINLQTVMEYYDAEKAIQYLKERGLKISAS